MIATPPLVGYLIVAAVAFAVGTLALPLAHRFGVAQGMIDLPRPGEAQERPLPRSGGYALYAGFFAGLLAAIVLFPRYPGEWLRLAGLVAGALLILPVAYLDDRYRLSPWPQFGMQVAVALVAVLFTIQIDMVRRIELPLLIAVPLTVLWIVGMINTVNFADGVDGLAGGVGAIAALTLFLVSVIQGQHSIAALPLALAAASLAFLRWNFFPSRLILGTSGATLIGFLLAVFSIIGGAKIAAALMVMGLPIADVASVILYRLLQRRSPFKGGDRAHLHHRLLDLGLTQRQVVYLFYALTAFLGGLAISLGAAGSERWPGLIPMAVIVVGVLAYVLSKTWRPARASRR
ncbi:MAG: MraY family glycosyltransferase [Chloroflexota bacterium]|nr:undecaprenyl/decaprenyl-phosphate alpha-N-acetylglucosaminyl 1-phosphate transferase [Dehalococcoidia bacterium]MDW8254087.1 MraY family glycosyltransferase [Chloroflexota bacterium]